MLLLNKRFLALVLISFGLIKIYVNVELIMSNKKQVIEIRKFVYKEIDKTYPTHHWMINNNVMQYSSYIIQKNGSSKAEIQSIIKIKAERSNIKQVKFFCLIKRTSTGEVVKIEPYKVIESIRLHVKKLFIEIDVIEDIENIAVAVIRSGDFIETQKQPKRFENKTYVLPFHMINFQKPEIIYVEESRRIKNLAMCVPITYSKNTILYKHFVEWNKKFKVGKLVLYDATPNKILSKLVDDHDGIVKIRPYCVEYECICNTEYLSFGAENETLAYIHLCRKLHEEFFKNVYKTRLTHEDITSNDCFIEMSKKYEFTSLYDFDEFIFPRMTSSAFEKKLFYETETSICSMNPFSMTLYGYIKKLVKKYFKHDFNKLSNIEVPHAAYFATEEHAVKAFIENLDKLAVKIENKEFDGNPIKLNLTFDKAHGHTFIIRKEDFNYVVNLSKQYKIFLRLYKDHVSNTTSLNSNLLRFFYHISNRAERLPKFIHYYKNVLAIWAHGSLKTTAGSVSLKLPEDSEHVLPHFRNDIRLLYKNYQEGSIKKLKIDYEYAVFLLKNFTNYC